MAEKRALAHVERIKSIRPIMGADNIDYATVLGWGLIIKKSEFEVGDLCVYFEIDSLLPQRPWSEFMKSKKYKVKTMRLGKFEGGIYSQGLALPLSAFVDEKYYNDLLKANEGDDVTDIIGVKYYVAEDNVRKSENIKTPFDVKFNHAMARHPKLAKNQLVRKLIKKKWGKKLLYFFIGSDKKDSDRKFPTEFEFVHKSDETRCENIGDTLFENKEEWIQTTKIDGTSSTYLLARRPRGKFEYYVCSRNVRMQDETQQTYHNNFGYGESNVYWDMEFKYHIRECLEDLLNKHKDWKYVCIQGESAGVGIQGNPHKLKDTELFVFNFIDSVNGRWNSVEAKNLLAEYGIQFVPIINEHYVLPNDMETLKLQADGNLSDDLKGASGLREGFVYRSLDGQRSFKNVSRKYLAKLKD